MKIYYGSAVPKGHKPPHPREGVGKKELTSNYPNYDLPITVYQNFPPICKL